MKPLPVDVTPAALADIDAAYQYFLARDPTLAARWLDCLDHTFTNVIAVHPHAASAARFSSPALRDIRRAAIRGFGKYLVFYRLESGRVVIARVLHGARDIAFIFGDD